MVNDIDGGAVPLAKLLKLCEGFNQKLGASEDLFLAEIEQGTGPAHFCLLAE